MHERTVARVLDYGTDIEPFRYIKIYAGVGSGKTHFACKMITGTNPDDEYTIPEQTVLLITSRRAKVEETLSDMGVAVKSFVGTKGNLREEVFNTGETRPPEYENFVRVFDYKDGEISFGEDWIHSQSVVCTNAYIEAYLKYCYKPNDFLTHLWNKFDTIIIDEVHSLVTDATYQTAPFAVTELIKEYINIASSGNFQESFCKHLIVMTGTPEPFERCGGITFPAEETIEHNLFEKCENVTPPHVTLLDSRSCIEKVRTLIENGEKAVYFSNRILMVDQAKSKFQLDDPERIGVSFSSRDKRNSLSAEEKQALMKIEEELKSTLLPDRIQLFVTTSKNKEGININNTDIHHVFVESHFDCDIIQMAGRVRNGLQNLYIISDSEQHHQSPDLLDVDFTKKVLVKPDDCVESLDEANRFLEKLCKDNGISDFAFCPDSVHTAFADYPHTIGTYINYIESRFAYVRYNYFKNCFCFYRLKFQAEQYEQKKISIVHQSIASKDYTALKSIYPNASFEVLASIEARIASALDTMIHPVGYRILTDNEKEKLLQWICEKLQIELREPNAILKRVGNYSIERHRAGNAHGIWRLFKGDDPLARPKRKSMGRKKK